MGELLAQDGHRGANALKDRGCEGGTDGQAVDKVVEAIAQCDHPGQRADVRVGSSFEPVTATCTGGRLSPAVWAQGVLGQKLNNSATKTKPQLE